MPRQPNYFLQSLPLEIRQRIYHLCGAPRGHLVLCLRFRYEDSDDAPTTDLWQISFQAGDWWGLPAAGSPNRLRKSRNILAIDLSLDELLRISSVWRRNYARRRGSGATRNCTRIKREPDLDFRHATTGPTNLLLTCHQIRDEVESILYGMNTFVVMMDWEGGLSGFKAALRDETRRKIRKLMMVVPRGDLKSESSSSFSLYPWWPPSWDDFKDDGGVLDNILSNLTMLAIITPPVPDKSGLPRSKAKRAERMGEIAQVDQIMWELKLKTTLPYLAKSLKDGTRVIVDTNEDEGSTSAVEEVFGKGRVSFQRICAANCLSYGYVAA